MYVRIKKEKDGILKRATCYFFWNFGQAWYSLRALWLNHSLVVESPAKAKTISKYLGRNYIVKASVGHIKDLPKSKLGVDVDDDFTPHYAVIPAKAKVVKELKSAAKGISRTYTWPRIRTAKERRSASTCSEELSSKSRNIYRVLFHEITKNAIEEAFKQPGRINQNKVDAQLTRRILDRLVGYKISPLLWDKGPAGTVRRKSPNRRACA